MVSSKFKIEDVLKAAGEALDLLRDLGENGRTVARSFEVRAGGARVAGGVTAGALAADPDPVRPERCSRDAIVDVFDEHDHVHVVAEFPGIDAEGVQFHLEGSVLSLEAGHGVRRCVEEVHLPSPVRGEGAVSSCRNGVFELKLPKA